MSRASKPEEEVGERERERDRERPVRIFIKRGVEQRKWRGERKDEAAVDPYPRLAASWVGVLGDPP